LPRFFLTLSYIFSVYGYSLFPFLFLLSRVTFCGEAISIICYAHYYKELWLLDPESEVVTKPQNLRNYYPTDEAHIQQDWRLQFYPLCDVEYQSQWLIFLWHFDTIRGHGLPLRGFTITVNGHSTLGRTPPDKTSVRRRDLYLKNTQGSQETNLYASGGIRIQNSRNRGHAKPTT